MSSSIDPVLGNKEDSKKKTYSVAMHFQVCKAFKESRKHSEMPQSYSCKGLPTGRWLSNKRNYYKAREFSASFADWAKRFEDLGFPLKRDGDKGRHQGQPPAPLDGVDRGADTANHAKIDTNIDSNIFLKSYLSLMEFKEEYGSFNVPSDHELSSFCKWARGMKHQGKLPPNQLCMLSAAHFPWTDFQGGFEALAKFASDKGHCNIPRQDPLYGWCLEVRSLQTKGKLPRDQYCALNAIGFNWIEGNENQAPKTNSNKPLSNAQNSKAKKNKLKTALTRKAQSKTHPSTAAPTLETPYAMGKGGLREEDKSCDGDDYHVSGETSTTKNKNGPSEEEEEESCDEEDSHVSGFVSWNPSESEESDNGFSGSSKDSDSNSSSEDRPLSEFEKRRQNNIDRNIGRLEKLGLNEDNVMRNEVTIAATTLKGMATFSSEMEDGFDDRNKLSSDNTVEENPNPAPRPPAESKAESPAAPPPPPRGKASSRAKKSTSAKSASKQATKKPPAPVKAKAKKATKLTNHTTYAVSNISNLDAEEPVKAFTGGDFANLVATVTNAAATGREKSICKVTLNDIDSMSRKDAKSECEKLGIINKVSGDQRSKTPYIDALVLFYTDSPDYDIRDFHI